jgi:asparagine N-glycosylation enzyme membrane subunit Stt3
MARQNPDPSLARRPPDPRLLALCFFVLALGVRLLNVSFVMDAEGDVRIAPVDELYHAKRMVYSAFHFPHVLEFDRDRGVDGAFCPWAPLYDVMAGGAARLLGATDANGVVQRVVWFPPILFALFTGLAVLILAASCGTAEAVLTGIALATSPFLVTTSWIGSIDHHYLESGLTFAILGAVCLALRARDPRERLRAGVLLGVAIVAAMFVQTALLISAALAFAVLFLFTDGFAGACGFGIAAFAVAIYRLTRAPGFPDNQWFLGWTHAALFAAAGVACAIVFRSPRPITIARRLLACVAGCAILLMTPTVPQSLFTGAHFLGGDRWLKTIQEFQPLWRARGADLLSDVVGLSGGVVLVWLLVARAWRTRDRVRLAIAFFAISYLLLTITSRRFWMISIPLLALAGAVYVPLIQRKRLALLAALAIALPPQLQLYGWLQTPILPVPPNQEQWLRAASFLSAMPPGRVLAPWSMGHAIDVVGHDAVVMDNFGTMPDAATFQHAQEALLAPDETTLIRYCDAAGVRYVILESPRYGIASANVILGLHRDASSTWWSHVWRGETPKVFQLIWSEPNLRIYQR